MDTETALELLLEKVIARAELKGDCLTITFTDNTTLTAAARSGGGGDGGWHTWTEVKINGQTIIDK